MERDFKGVWVPKEIWLAHDLSWTEKMLLVEIDSLSRNDECFATNEYFAKFFKLKKDTISKAISSLKSKGYVEVKLEYKEGTKEISRRVISTIGYRKKILEGIGEKSDTPIGEKSEDNNININNTNINKYKERKNENIASAPSEENSQSLKSQEVKKQEVENIPLERASTKKAPKQKTSTYDDILEAEVQDPELIELYVEFIKMRKLIKAPLTDRALKILIKRVNTLEPNDIERQKELLDTAIMNNWKSVYELKDTNKSQKTTSYNTKEYESTNIFDQLLNDKPKDVITVDGDDIS